MLVDFGKAGWLGKARRQPEKVRAVLDKVRSEGLVATWRAVRAKLEQPIPLGYCNAGVVVDAGGAVGFAPGDRVVSNGPHAEVVSVAGGMCARIPEGVANEAAAFTPLAAIALQGINLLAVAPGDQVVVTGLGLIGQLAVRILRAQECEVLGFDPSAERRALAERHGARTASGDPVVAAMAWTLGRGVAGVLITASTASNEVVNQAARSCRHRGRVVLVGVVGLRLNRADFYRNEVSFQVSRSYGARIPGAGDSAQSNFHTVLDLMAAGRLLVDDLITHRFPFVAAPAAYAALSDRRALGIVMEYAAPANRALAGGPGHVRTESLRPARQTGVGEGGERLSSPIHADEEKTGRDLNSKQGAKSAEPEGERRNKGRLGESVFTEDGRERWVGISADERRLAFPTSVGSGVRVGLIGAGNFATRTLLPALAGLPQRPILAAVASNQGVSAVLAAQAFGAALATTDPRAIYEDPSITAVLITTRHNSHAAEVLAALAAGKHVWVEKPLCLTLEELAAIESCIGSAEPRGGVPSPGTLPEIPIPHHPTAVAPVRLMVGFNRRFAPMAVALREALSARKGPHRLSATVNAGRLDPEHWILDPRVGGGRIVGEACHFVDLLRFLVGVAIEKVTCTRRDTDGQDGGRFELQFADGSAGCVDYRTDLPPHVPKERIEVTGEGYSATIDNWARPKSRGLDGLALGSRWSRTPRKGHPEALAAFLAAVRGDRAEPIAFQEILEVSRWAIAMQGMEGES